ncbi:MAG: hypothetical protein J7L23_04025 [Candidatus Diapherotrites archaeon]|nr:hypothetical protein [Candidatus Diapherotrites archaeon]
MPPRKKPRGPRRPKEHKGDLFSGIRRLGFDLPSIGKIFADNGGRIREISLMPSELNNEKKLSWLHKNKIRVSIEGVLENKGSLVEKVGKPRLFLSNEPIVTSPGSEAVPVTVFTPYAIHAEDGRPLDNLIALRRYNYKMSADIIPSADGELDYTKKFLRGLEEKGKIKLPWLKKVKDLKVLFKKLKREGGLPAEIIDLSSLKNHKSFLKAIQHYKMKEHHNDSLMDASFHKTIHFNGTVKGKIRKTTLRERLLMEKLGLKPKKYVLEVLGTKEDPEVSPELRLKQQARKHETGKIGKPHQEFKLVSTKS